jgi:hypothetical protein
VLALKNDVDSLLHPGAQKRYDDFVEVHKNAMISGPAMIMPMPHGGLSVASDPTAAIRTCPSSCRPGHIDNTSVLGLGFLRL